MRESSIIRQLLNTSYPGTIDTSLVATDGNNNPNTMNAIYGVIERINVSLVAATGREKVARQTYESIGTLAGLELGRLVRSDAGEEEVQGVLRRVTTDAAFVRRASELFSVDDYGVVHLVLPEGADRKVPHVLAVGEDSVGTLAAAVPRLPEHWRISSRVDSQPQLDVRPQWAVALSYRRRA